MPLQQYPQEENILQLSKQAMNTDSSQMLYPDFTHNMNNFQSMQPPFPIGIVENNSDYYDIAEIK